MFLRVLLCVLLCSTQAFALDTSLKGITDSALSDNIEAHLSTLDMPQNCQFSDNFRATVEEKVRMASQALGFYQTKLVDIQSVGTTSCSEAKLTLEQGSRVMVRELSVTINGDAAQDPEFMLVVNDFPLKRQTPMIHQKYESGKRKIESLAQSRGYFDSKFEKHEIRLDVQNNVADITLVFSSGKRYMFGELEFTEDLRAIDLIKSVAPFSASQPYLSSTLGIFNQNLKQTGYFQQVVARPLVQKAIDFHVPIEIIATAKPRDIFNVGGGASTDTGPRVKLSWQRPWVNRSGHSISSDIFVSAPKQSVSVKYKIPVDDPLHDFYTLQAGFKAENDNDTNSDTLSLAVQRHWASEEQEWNKILFLRYEQERFQQGDDPFDTTRLLIPGFTLSRHRTKGGLDVFWGDQQQVTIETATKTVVSDIDLTRITMQTKWLRSLGQHRFFLRAEVGAMSTNDFSRVPSSLRYFAGGDQSVRGFSYETLAPRDPETDKLVGAKYLNVASIEYSYPFADSWRGAIFTDVGNATNEPLKDLAYSAGVGVSWLSPVGPIRLYLAKELSNYGDDSFRIHFAMGPML